MSFSPTMRVEAIEHTHVLVVEVDVDVAVEPAIRGENSCDCVSGCCSATVRRISPTDDALGAQLLLAPTDGRSTGGMRTVAIAS